MPHQWWLVTLTLETSAQEMASAILFDHGSTGIITLEEGDTTVTIGAYFNEHSSAQLIAQSIESMLSQAGHPRALRDCTVSSVVEEDWLQKWKEGFNAVQIGESILVSPSWKLPKEDPGRVVIQIDPGMAFGTGTHETTRLCLEAIEKHWHGGSLLDVGTGTGILAIGAALLQPGSRVVAIDIDPRAVEVAGENIVINNLSGKIDLSAGQPHALAGKPFEVVVANLTAEVIVELMHDLASCVANAGLLILSGILSILAVEVEEALIAAGFTIIERNTAGEWSALVALKT